MKKFIFISVALSMVLLSCKSGESADKDLVTKRIQYDVVIQNPDVEMDWWVQNIEGSNREKLLKDIFQSVLTGEVKTYDFNSYKPYSVDEIKNIMKRTDSISMESPIPPYDVIDTVMITEIRHSDIKKLRFLEEWRMNEKTLAFTKKVAGICPMLERRSDSGELLGYKPLFLMFFDEKYPAELEQK